jgi:hypothetical protein
MSASSLPVPLSPFDSLQSLLVLSPSSPEYSDALTSLHQSPEDEYVLSRIGELMPAEKGKKKKKITWAEVCTPEALRALPNFHDGQLMPNSIVFASMVTILLEATEKQTLCAAVLKQILTSQEFADSSSLSPPAALATRSAALLVCIAEAFGKDGCHIPQRIDQEASSFLRLLIALLHSSPFVPFRALTSLFPLTSAARCLALLLVALLLVALLLL